MSCLTQHKTKEELSNWLMENASDNETTGFLDMLAGDIWDMMTAETELKEKTAKHLGMAETLHDAVVEENKKLKKENENYEAMMIDAEAEDQGRDNTIAFLEEKNKQLQESDKHLNKCIDSIRDQYLELKEENKKLQEREYEMCQTANAMGWDIYPTDSEEESEE